MLAMMTTVHAGSFICDPGLLPWLEDEFYSELDRTDYKNMSFADHLEHYLNPKWTEECSFCINGESREMPTEAYTGRYGLCFILNAEEKIYSPR